MDGTSQDVACDVEPGYTYHRTDLGNAEMFHDMFRGRVRFCHPRKSWFLWTGKRWILDKSSGAADLANQVARRRLLDAPDAGDRDDVKREMAWAYSSESARGRKNCLEQASTLPGLIVYPEAFDNDPWALNVLNGTIDLRTGKLRPHRREDYLTTLAPVVYDPDAKCPLWDAFLHRIFGGDQDMIDYVHRNIGYSLTGLTVEEIFYLLHGSGRNGKGTMVETVAALLGPDYCRKLPVEALLEQKHGQTGPTPEIAKLKGARFAHATESNETRRLNEGFIKEMTGGDTLTGRFLNENPIEFSPTHKLWLSTNHKPEIRSAGEGIWSRVHFIPFEVTIPLEERDPHLKRKLRAELSGILARAVRGCLEWQERGLDRPDKVRQATEEYRSDSDVFGRFLEDRCILRPSLEASATSIRSAYEDWAKEQGERPLSATRIGRDLQDRGFSRHKRDGRIIWHGLDVRLHQGGREDLEGFPMGPSSWSTSTRDFHEKASLSLPGDDVDPLLSILGGLP